MLVLIARPNHMESSRFGFSVRKRLGGAVVRNTVKRRLRETARLSQVEGGWDLIVIPREEAASADFHQIRRSMASLLKRAGVAASGPAAPDRPEREG